MLLRLQVLLYGHISGFLDFLGSFIEKRLSAPA